MVSLAAITPSPPKKTANTRTASTTNIGAPTPRRCPSTSTALSTCPNRKRLRIPWKGKVRLGLSCYCGRCADPCLVRDMAELISQVKDEQSYIIGRERTHRNTAESTNARIKWWSIFQLAFLIGQGVFQVWWLKRFFEVGPATFSRSMG